MGGRGAFLVRMAAAALLAASIPATTADASWLTKIIHEAAEAGGKVLRRGGGGLEHAQSVLKRLPVAPKGGALAATVSPEGHWTFMNAAGEAFTAGTPDELKRVSQILLGAGALAESKLTLLLTEEAIFERASEISKLPKGADLRLVAGDDAYPLVRRSGVGDRFLAEVRPSLLVDLSGRRLFREMRWQLNRPLDRVQIRVVALEPGRPAALPQTPKLEPATRRVLSDTIDPYRLGEALRGISGQTVALTGRIEGRLLHFRPSSGTERSLDLESLIKAAEAADVSLLVLHSTTPRQPGGRNWLWQRVTVAGLEDGMARATFSDFLNALAEGQGHLLVYATERPNGRLAMRVRPLGVDDGASSSGGVSEIVSDLVSEVTGRVVTSAIEADLVSSERQRELEARVIPGVPASVQYGYLAMLIGGLMGLSVAAGWWRRIWPPERREGYGAVMGYQAARLVRLVCFIALYLPLVGPPALLCTLVLQAWGLLLTPVRIWRWIAGRASQPAT